jgi:hypothetical protein
LTPPYAAVIVEPLLEVTAIPVTLNVPLVDPAAIVNVAGTVATAVALLVRAIDIPPAGAGPLSVTVAVDDAPPSIVVGLRLTDERSGTTVSVCEDVAPA